MRRAEGVVRKGDTKKTHRETTGDFFYFLSQAIAAVLAAFNSVSNRSN